MSAFILKSVQSSEEGCIGFHPKAALRDSAYYLAMQLAEHPTPPLAAVTDSASLVCSGVNHAAYVRLKTALSLNLRRQIFIAVCDDLALRNRLAARLYAELAYPSSKPMATDVIPTLVRVPGSGFSSANDRGVSVDQRLSLIVDERDAPLPSETLPPSQDAKLPSRLLYPEFVSLNLNLNEPNPMVQIAEWLAQYPPPKGANQRSRSPGFQILGTERLTRQAAPIQKRFLTSLQQIEHYLSCLESALLLWLPRPWLHVVQQSAPAFWNWHTALFEFEGDPTPAATRSAQTNAATTASTMPVKAQKQRLLDYKPLSSEAIVRPTAATPIKSVPSTTSPVNATTPSTTPSTTGAATGVSNHQTQAASTSGELSESVAAPLMAQKDDLWEILSHDLALLHDASQNQAASANPLDVVSPDLYSPIVDRATTPPLTLTVTTVDTLEALPDQTSDRAECFDQNSPDAAEFVLVPSEAVSEEPSEALAYAVVPAIESSSSVATSNEPIDAALSGQPLLTLTDLLLAIAAEEAGTQTFSQDARAIQALQQIEQLHQQEASGTLLLAAYQHLGTICRDHIEQGNASSAQLRLTIAVYEQMLRWLDESPQQWSDLLNDIGNLYWMLSRQGAVSDEDPPYLERAIAAYQQALTKTHPQTYPQSYAMIQNNLGSAYGDRARYQSPAESLQQSVAAYEAALRYRKLDDDPVRYAATQNNLGTAYWNLAQHEQPVRRLKQAIAAYFEALRYYSPDCEPMHYAMIQNNLGTAYWNLSQQPQATLKVGTTKGKELAAMDLLQRAIAAYGAALVYRTLEVAPAAYAATQNNLGTAYWQLASLLEKRPQRRTFLERAIEAYKAAIAAVQYLSAASTAYAPALSFDPSATHNNLGLAYYQLATDKHQQDNSTQRSTHLEAALHHHLQALQGCQPQSDMYQAVFSYVIQTIRTFHSDLGTKGQTLALSQIPPTLLPEVIKRL